MAQKWGFCIGFLGLGTESPLFGRAMGVVELSPFTRDQVAEFLRRGGFEELGIEFRDFDAVYEKLGGIPGWLTYFGLRYYEYRDLDKAINETMSYATALIRQEFHNFLTDKVAAKDRYLAIMRIVARECAVGARSRTGLR